MKCYTFLIQKEYLYEYLHRTAKEKEGPYPFFHFSSYPPWQVFGETIPHVQLPTVTAYNFYRIMSNTHSAVVIIIYTPTPSSSEEASLVQCVNVLGQHDILLVCPESLNLQPYLTLCKSLGCTPRVQKFADKWFCSVDTYNHLMLQSEFYRRFTEYDYILLYQLDAWVFKDDLDNWCTRGYSYVGAPFFNDRGEMFPFVGNGGFSLRRVASFIALLEGRSPTAGWNYSFLWVHIPSRTKFTVFLKKLIHIAELMLCRMSSRWYCTLHHEHEDFIFAKAFAFTGAKNVPQPQEAAFFSFERYPERLFSLTDGTLPFGCHAHEKYEPKFWRPWIPS